jgi:DNA-binding GntR family transcriptional regulator
MVLQKKSNQAEQAYRELRRMLLELGLSPGTKLGETACAQKLGVNRGDARMAMARLFSEGLLEKGTKCGYRVPLLTAEQKAEIYEARLILETAAARLAVQRATKSDLHRFHDICNDMEMMAEKGYSLGVCEADLRFHEALIQAAHNSKLTQIYLCSNLPLTFEKTVQKELTEELLQDVRKHRIILAALEERDGDRVAELLEKGMVYKNKPEIKVSEME